MSDISERPSVDAKILAKVQPTPAPSPLTPRLSELRLKIILTGKVTVVDCRQPFETVLMQRADIDAGRLSEFNAALERLLKDFEDDEIPF